MASSKAQARKQDEPPRDDVVSSIVDAYIERIEALSPQAQRVANRVLQESILGAVVLWFFDRQLATEAELVQGRILVEQLYERATQSRP